MEFEFLNSSLEEKELLTQTKVVINPFLLENNASQIQKLYNFYKGDVNILFLNGAIGTGKAEIVNYSTSFLSKNTIVLKYNCFNSTVLDDIFLSFFREFKKLASQNIISEPKTRTENFTQKINSYFSQIEKPFVVLFDSFESILEENRQEILDFVTHISSMQKVKVIIVGRSFENKYFDNLTIERITTLAFQPQIFEKYLKGEKIKATTAIYDEFFKHTQGNYFFTALAVKLMHHYKQSLVDFLAQLKAGYVPFIDFLEKQALKLVPITERDLFWFLTLIRHPININLLKKLKFYNEEKVKFLIDNFIIVQDDSLIYVQDYLKEEIDESQFGHILQKIRQYIIDLYSTQLPLKPLERDMCISRQTMRKEIEYHNLFMPKKPQRFENVNLGINYLSYSNVFGMGDKSKEAKSTTDNKPSTSSNVDSAQRKNVNLNVGNLPFQNVEKNKQQGPEKKEDYKEKKYAVKELISLIKEAEKAYQYSKMIEYCQKALLLKTDSYYQMYLPTIYSKIAFAYQKNADHEKAINYYELAKDYYQKTQNLVKVNSIKFNIAQILYETFKGEQAKTILFELINSPESTPVLIVKSYLCLSNIEESLSNHSKAFEYCKQAIKLSDEDMDVETLSELYFKYALIMDEQGNIKAAIDYYNKCISLNNNFMINKFISSAYSNIAALYLEKNEMDLTIENYIKAYDIDQQSESFEGMYYSSSKIANLLRRRDPKEALKYFKKALQMSKLLNDKFYIVSACLAIGDFYYDRSQSEIALKYYIESYDVALNNMSKENMGKIKSRIHDIQVKLGMKEFENLVEIIRRQAAEHE